MDWIREREDQIGLPDFCLADHRWTVGSFPEIRKSEIRRLDWKEE